MATVAELAARPYQEVGYLFVVEGWPVSFTNRADLAGADWIAESGRRVALGLEVPQSVTLAVGIVESGMPCDDGLTVTIVDREGYLISLMEDDPGEPATERLAAATDPAPATLLSGENSVDLHDRWINGEKIGSSGERRQYGILPGVQQPGYDHAAIDAEVGSLRQSVVREAARWLEGLPCALYLIRKDTQTGTWPSWQDQYESGYSLIWWGTLRGTEAESHAWKLSCDGPSSWLRRALNVTAPTEWQGLFPILTLESDENRFAAAFSYRNPQGTSEACTSSAYTASDVITSGQSRSDTAAQINTRLQTLAAAGGTPFTTAGGTVQLNSSGLTLRVQNNTSGPAGYTRMGMFQLRMHRKVWLHLGWDLDVQSCGQSYVSDVPQTTREVVTSVNAGSFVPLSVSPTSDWGPDYVEAEFITAPVGQSAHGNPSTASTDGDGAPRKYEPLYPSSTYILHPDGQQALSAGVELQPYWVGQLAQPPASVTLGSGACDRSGFIVVRGPYKTEVDGDETELHLLARVSWADGGDKLQVDSDSRALMWLEGWLDGREWGAADPPLSGPWAALAGGVQWAPIAVLGRGGSSASRADSVLLQILLSSGTGSWSGSDWVPGANSHPLANAEGDDREVADLGLCIPHEMIDYATFGRAAAALPGGKAGPLNRTRLAYVGPFDSQQAIEDILAPRGWCFSLKAGQYGLFARHEPLDLDDVEVALDQPDVAGDVDELPPSEEVDFRPLEPIDLVTTTWGATQLGGGDGNERELTIKARDPRAQQRRGNASVDVEGRTLVSHGLHSHWQSDFSKLWGDELARWFGEPHATVIVRIKGDVARDLWPGTVVSYTSPWPATRNGAYGMSNRVGRVFSVERDTLTLAATVRILVDGVDPTSKRRFGPIARLVDDHETVEERHDAATRTIFCQADAFGRGEDTSDVAGFAKPSWTSGTAALAYVWQSYDGITWTLTAAFDVESIDTSANTITYVDGTLSGTIHENRLGIITIAPHPDQTPGAWPQSTFGVVCGTDDKFGPSNTSGFPWVD